MGVGEKDESCRGVGAPLQPLVGLSWAWAGMPPPRGPGQGLPLLKRAVDVCQQADLPANFPRMAAALGAAYTLAGRLADAVPLLTQARDQSAATSRAHQETLCSSCWERRSGWRATKARGQKRDPQSIPYHVECVSITL